MKPAAIEYGNTLRFFAGQPDRNNAARFTIGYVVDGKAGTIEGLVRDEGLELRPLGAATLGEQKVIDRNGGTVGFPYDAAWDLAAPPATPTQPSSAEPRG